jgi:hypothetical protein
MTYLVQISPGTVRKKCVAIQAAHSRARLRFDYARGQISRLGGRSLMSRIFRVSPGFIRQRRLQPAFVSAQAKAPGRTRERPLRGHSPKSHLGHYRIHVPQPSSGAYAARSTHIWISLWRVSKSIGMVSSPEPFLSALRFVDAPPQAVILMMGISRRSALGKARSSPAC